MKIIGATVGTTTPKPNFDQTDPRKGDFIKGDRSFLRVDDTLTESGISADARAVGEAINAVIANVDELSNQKSDVGHNHDGSYDAKGSASSALASAKSYTDTKFESIPSVDAYTKAEINAAFDEVNEAIAGKANSSHTHTIANVTNLQSSLDEKVPTSRTVNGKALSTNISLTASDVGAASSSHSHNDVYYTETEVDSLLSGKSDTSHKHDNDYDAKGAANTALASAKTYADSAATKVKDELLNGAGAAYDTLKELGDLINDNQDAIDALEIVAVSKADASVLDSHTGNKSNPHGVTAAQISAVPTSRTVNGKALSANITLSAGDVGAASSTHSHNDTYYTKNEIDNLELISVDDIDTICSTIIQVVTIDNEVRF